ncbi:MAG: integrase core domain-containing protein [Methylocella sp.]
MFCRRDRPSNEAVERCNGVWRHEFHAGIELPTQIGKIAAHAEAFQHLSNHQRPHGALAGQTPASYVVSQDNELTAQLAEPKIRAPRQVTPGGMPRLAGITSCGSHLGSGLIG